MATYPFVGTVPKGVNTPANYALSEDGTNDHGANECRISSEDIFVEGPANLWKGLGGYVRC